MFIGLTSGSQFRSARRLKAEDAIVVASTETSAMAAIAIDALPSAEIGGGDEIELSAVD